MRTLVSIHIIEEVAHAHVQNYLLGGSCWELCPGC